MTQIVRLWILKRVVPLTVASIFSGISVASEVGLEPANFVLSMRNTTGGTYSLNGPASEGIAYAPAYNCANVTSEGYTGPFRFEKFPPGTAQYAFSSQSCESKYNVIEFVLQNNQSNTGCLRSGWPNSRLFNTSGVNTCLFWNIKDPAFVLGIYREIDINSKLTKIELVLQRAP